MFLSGSSLRSQGLRNSSKTSTACSTSACTYHIPCKGYRGGWAAAGHSIKLRPVPRVHTDLKSLEDFFTRSLATASSCAQTGIARGSVGQGARYYGSASRLTRRWLKSNRREASQAATSSKEEDDNHVQSENQPDAIYDLPGDVWDSLPTNQSTTKYHRSMAGQPTTNHHHSTASDSRLPQGLEIERSVYRDLVNTYNSSTQIWHPERRGPPSDTPASSDGSQSRAPSPEQSLKVELQPAVAPHKSSPPLDEAHGEAIWRFRSTLGRSLGVGGKEVWLRYQEIPTPRPRYLTDWDLHRLFRHLTWVQNRDLESSRRFFSVLDECLDGGIPVHTHWWNTAIAFAGKWAHHTTIEEVRAAIEIWMEMEREGGKTDAITYNILFDIAVRAGRFALADTISKSLSAQFPLDRHFRVSNIYYAGERGDGSAVRTAFYELVTAGEIVDTTVMNCVIASLIRAGEAASAEYVLAKMKELHQHKFPTEPLRDWRNRKHAGAILNRVAAEIRASRGKHKADCSNTVDPASERMEHAQRIAPIAPDDRTYALLLQWHATMSGDLVRVDQLLNELKEGGWEIQGRTYLHLFKGFDFHGGYAHAAWKRGRLEAIWTDFVAQACTGNTDSSGASSNPGQGNNVERPRFMAPVVSAAVRAFYRCAGKNRAIQVWEEVQDKWPEMTQAQYEWVELVVERIRRLESIYED